MPPRLSVVISQSPSKNPKKRKLEEDIVIGSMIESGIDVTVVPNLYDLKPDGTGMLALKKLGGHLVVCSWLFERASHWVLDRNGIHGHVGETLLKNEDDDEQDEEESDSESDQEKNRVVDQREIPDRRIYCLDLKISTKASDYVEEIKRIHRQNAVQVVSLGGVGGESNRSLPVLSSPSANGSGMVNSEAAISSEVAGEASETIQRIEENDGRRWYPVIDYSRCTNCMECIDFCLFGVYGVDRIDTILVEQPDNCRKGCPACSRVCPENAIMFPQHKTPAIAGSAESAASMKIDLSQLFGAPASSKSAEEIAAMERDEQLALAGRETVGMQGLKKRQENRIDQPKDDLDSLVDQLNDLDI